MDQAPIDAHSRLGLAVLLLLCCATWALTHRYVGLFHDAGLYTLQALSHLHPGALSQDVFLKFGSQDRFTLFSPAYAGAARMVGIEPAAALLTLLFQAALLAGAWCLARAVMPSSMALLGLAVLIAVPGDYGADRVFTCIEPFLTPRMAAEALTLASLAAAMRSQRVWAGVLVVAATLIHPVMAAAGVAALLCLYVAIPRPRLSLGLAAAGLVAIAAAAFLTPAGPWGRFDPTWFELVKNRSPYLFVEHWQLDDWSRAAVSLATLAIALPTLPNARARALSQISLISALGGFALTLYASDFLHLVRFTQLQPWRWQWLATVAAALLLPQTLRMLWSAQTAGRSTGLLLISAWLFASNAYALAAVVAALASLICTHRLKSSEARWVLWGSCGMLAIALAWRLASNLQFTEAYYLEPTIPLWLRRSIAFARDGSVPIAIMTLAWWLMQRRCAYPALMLLGAAAIACCGALAPQTWHAWTARAFPPLRAAQFAPLRDKIPPGSQVFWPDSPVAVWLLLDRPSYLSVIQTSGMVFSRQGAIEMDRRAHALSEVLPASTFMGWSASGLSMSLSREQLLQACTTGEFEFLITQADLGFDPWAVLPSASGTSWKASRLYRCKT